MLANPRTDPWGHTCGKTLTHTEDGDCANCVAWWKTVDGPISKPFALPPTHPVPAAAMAALGQAVFTFQSYARLHAEKGTVTGYEKALANAKLAEQMSQALNACV